MGSVKVETVSTVPIDGQKTGTSGLRKTVATFKEKNFLQNWVQSLFNSLDNLEGKTLVLGGDGRYFNREAIQVILNLAAGNRVGKVVVGQNGIFSTPSVSAIIRKYNYFGGIILTASHNPGGPNADFGIKYNVSNGGPAPESVTDAIFENTQKISQYQYAPLPEIDLTSIGKYNWTCESANGTHDFTVEVIDSCADYVELMKQIFDFTAIRKLLSRSDFSFVFDCLNGVTGPYAKRVFVDELQGDKSSIVHGTPLEDFGGLHPDPNLTYAAELVESMFGGSYDFGAAWDGDGDRNMVLGKSFFVNPSDALAIIAANIQCIPYYSQGLCAFARSMPTSGALDLVAKEKNTPLYEVPTGWKFFGNIMDHFAQEGKGTVLCGEESFGTGSDHIREKDGIWAVLAWLSIIAHANKSTEIGHLVSVESIVKAHWKKFGRNYYSRYDYEQVDSNSANKMMEHLKSVQKEISNNPAAAKNYLGANMQLQLADDFQYYDEFDQTTTSQQGLRFVMEDGSRFVFRLSGTGSVGATIRLYLERYDKTNHQMESHEALKDYIKAALEISKLQEFTGREAPTVIT